MIDFYALTSPNVRKIFIMLEEVELAYNAIPVDVWKGDNYSPEFRKVNPNGKIPVIVDHDGPGGRAFTLIESGAILMYLADKTGRFLPKETAPRYEVLQWLMIQLTGVGPNFGQLTHFKLFAPPGNEYSLSRFQTEVRRLYDVLEARLATCAYLGGPDYSIADIATYPWAANHQRQGVSFADKPNLARWHAAIAARPAVARATQKAEAMPTSREHAKPDDVDRFFGRGRYARG
jgi:GST-like protein